MQTTAESKLITYLGFSIKAGKITFGIDRMEKLRKAKLLLYDEDLSDNSKKQANKFAAGWCCPVIVCKEIPLAELLHKKGCKAAALTDENLAKAVLTTVKDNEKFSLFESVGVGGNI